MLTPVWSKIITSTNFHGNQKKKAEESHPKGAHWFSIWVCGVNLHPKNGHKMTENFYFWRNYCTLRDSDPIATILPYELGCFQWGLYVVLIPFYVFHFHASPCISSILSISVTFRWEKYKKSVGRIFHKFTNFSKIAYFVNKCLKILRFFWEFSHDFFSIQW